MTQARWKMERPGSSWSTWRASRITDYCRERACTIDQRLRLFRAVCEAVQYAHRQTIIHRDLKPSNILVKADGTVKLLDFGIAKQLQDAEQEVEQSITQTLTGLRPMTLQYASPEQIRGESLGTQTDVYSLGVLLYELLTGQLPFDFSSRSPTEAEQIILQQEPGTAFRPPGHIGVAARKNSLGRAGCPVPDGHAQGFAKAIPVGRSADPRYRSLPQRRTAGSAAG
jgi:serine/threonine protein kinase